MNQSSVYEDLMLSESDLDFQDIDLTALNLEKTGKPQCTRVCPLSGGHWSNGSHAGVWAFNLNSVRGTSNDSVGFRSALYL